MPFLQLDDVRLFFTDEGAGGTPALLVHGFSADSHDWCWQLAHLGGARRVIAVDLRGHGASSAPADGYTTARFAEDLVAVLDHLGVATVVAFGHSMGGSVVSALAVEHPERVAAIVAVDPAYLIDDELPAALVPVLEGLDDAALVPFVQGLIGDGMDTPGRDPGLRAWQVRRIETVDPHALRRTLVAQVSGMALRSESEPYLRRRSCPVLSFHADPARAVLEATLFADERSRVVAWEGVGHWLHQERADELNPIVDGWLDTLG